MRRRFIGSAKHVVVLTGAGVSVASGLRPYRGPGGLWSEQPELVALATAAAFEKDAGSVWSLFGPERSPVARAVPNPAHRALAALEAGLPDGLSFHLITQNIDHLHQRAGSRKVIELHGNLARTRCSNRGCDLVPYDDDSAPTEAPPCPQCQSPLRPDIVLFDEPIPVEPEWQSKTALRQCDLFMAIGTSGTVSPASNFVRAAEYAGARTIYINLEPMHPPDPRFQESVLGPAEHVLPELFDS